MGVDRGGRRIIKKKIFLFAKKKNKIIIQYPVAFVKRLVYNLM